MSFYQTLLDATQDERERLLSTPVISRGVRGEISLETYRGFLTEAYHHVKYTVPLLMACGARLPERLEWLREAVAEYIEEETGHQEWILDDIAAAGGNPETVRRGKPGQATDLMVAYAWDTVNRRNPVGFFGMVLVLEGTSVLVASQAADRIQDALHLPNQAFRYLRSHGAIDQEHIGFFHRLMDRLDDSADQQAVIDTARIMYPLYRGIFESLPGQLSREAA